MRRRHRARLIGVGVLSAATIACGATDDAVAPQSTAVIERDAVEAIGGVAVPDRAAATADPSLAGAAISAIGLDLFGTVRASAAGENVTLSPASIAIALAMVEPGTNDSAQAQLRQLLRIDDPAAFHASMNALEQNLERRAPEAFNEDDDPGELTLRVANAAYLQDGYTFLPAYLDAVGAAYGPALNQVDFAADPDAVAHEINDYVADATSDRIVDLLADGDLRPETVFALVNALYLKASWLDTFDEAATGDQTFTTLDGTDVTVPMMNGTSGSSARGDGWIGATRSYVGGLSAQFIVPDDGRFDEVANRFGSVLTEYDSNRTSGTTFSMPRFETRTHVNLPDALRTLGLTAPFEAGGLVGMAGDPRLVIDNVIHEAFVSMDEDGTEAAAATVVYGYPVSAPMLEPVPVVIDRPFLYRIFDDQTGATLFIGQVVNPDLTS